MSAPNPASAKAKLSVTKGLRSGKTYALKEGVTYIGRKGPQAVDVDLTEQEMPGVAVQVNRFALVWFDKNGIGIADTGTRIGTTVNGAKIPKGKRGPAQGRGYAPVRQDGASGQGDRQGKDRRAKVARTC